MRSAIRRRPVVLALLASIALAAIIVAGVGGASAHTARSTSAGLTNFSLDGYVLNAEYTQGRNTGNTFQQTYKASTVQGVPIRGPYVGTTFPVEDYIAYPIGDHELYVAWMSTSDAKSNPHPLLDVFVMNFKSHKVYDYAPGSLAPYSVGSVTLVKQGRTPLP